jgi:hypothetical protein
LSFEASTNVAGGCQLFSYSLGRNRSSEPLEFSDFFSGPPFRMGHTQPSRIHTKTVNLAASALFRSAPHKNLEAWNEKIGFEG